MVGDSLEDLTTRSSGTSPSRRSTSSAPTRSRRAVGRVRRPAHATFRRAPDPTAWPPRWRRRRPNSAAGRPPAALPERAAEGGARGDHDAARRRAGGAVPGGDGEAVRHRPGTARSTLNDDRARDVSTSARSSGSTTSSGKEAAQNILAFRFANGLFEPIWNRNFIDHIQIDIPETLGLDRRAGFYEATGAYKDMVVTHLLQVLAFVAMEPPTALEPRAISEEKNKVFRSMLPIDPRRRGPRPVQRLPRRGGGRAATPTPRPSSR